MSPKAPPMNHQCEIVSVSRDKYGSYLETGSVPSRCRIRYIVTRRQSIHGEEIQSDAQIWLPAETNVKEGDIIRADSQSFQVDRINLARDLDTPIIHFLKCDLQIIRITDG